MRLYHVDAFADAPFTGNPAAVCLLGDREPDAVWMQRVAAEMNLAETAFVRHVPRHPEHSEGSQPTQSEILRAAQDDAEWSLRWFTPTVEVALCGHATLASAQAMFEEGLLEAGGTARFHTLSGVLSATHRGEMIELNFPAILEEASQPAEGLVDALVAKPVNVSKNRFDYLVEVASEDEVRSLTPDYARLRKIHARGAIVTSRASTPGFDFVSRFFAPASGIDEDPVTGSAHCALAPYWAQRLGKNEFVAYQASPRGGVVYVTLDGDRVRLGGRAITVFRGELAI